MQIQMLLLLLACTLRMKLSQEGLSQSCKLLAMKLLRYYKNRLASSDRWMMMSPLSPNYMCRQRRLSVMTIRMSCNSRLMSSGRLMTMSPLSPNYKCRPNRLLERMIPQGNSFRPDMWLVQSRRQGNSFLLDTKSATRLRMSCKSRPMSSGRWMTKSRQLPRSKYQPNT